MDYFNNNRRRRRRRSRRYPLRRLRWARATSRAHRPSTAHFAFLDGWMGLPTTNDDDPVTAPGSRAEPTLTRSCAAFRSTSPSSPFERQRRRGSGGSGCVGQVGQPTTRAEPARRRGRGRGRPGDPRAAGAGGGAGEMVAPRGAQQSVAESAMRRTAAATETERE